MIKLNKEQVAQKLDVSQRKLDYMISRGEFPPGVRHGKQLLWADAMVTQFDELRFRAQMAWLDRVRAATLSV